MKDDFLKESERGVNPLLEWAGEHLFSEEIDAMCIVYLIYPNKPMDYILDNLRYGPRAAESPYFKGVLEHHHFLKHKDGLDTVEKYVAMRQRHYNEIHDIREEDCDGPDEPLKTEP